MSTPRSFLPSTALLSAFEAAARLGSITAAAQELNFTQSAVSRQIKALEEQLQARLFVRENQSIRITPAGEVYAREIGDALRRIRAASLNIRANPGGGTLNLAILPTFGSRWLAPRLPKFFALHPGVTLNMTTRLSYFEFRMESFDAAIHFGQPYWPEADLALLRSEEVLPVCSPQLKKRAHFRAPDDLKKEVLLHLSTRPDAWEQWFALHGASRGAVPGMLFDQFATIAQTTMSGVGVALLPTFLIRDELDSGRLVPAFDLPMPSAGRYYLAWPPERALHPPLKAFREWLIAESALER
jgi:LysR family glycine cleavage system transcriptional activator